MLVMRRKAVVVILGVGLALCLTAWGASYRHLRLFLGPWRELHLHGGVAEWTRYYSSRDIATMMAAWDGNPMPWSAYLAKQLQEARFSVAVWGWPPAVWAWKPFSGWQTDWRLFHRRSTSGLLRVGVPLWIPTAVVGAALWLMASPLRAYRRRRRLRQGCCQTCGYDLRGSAGGCPECGQRRPETERSV